MNTSKQRSESASSVGLLSRGRSKVILSLRKFDSTTERGFWWRRLRRQKPMLSVSDGLTLRAGKVYAVIGKSGAGKTVLNSFFMGYPAFSYGRETVVEHLSFMGVRVPSMAFRTRFGMNFVWGRIRERGALLYLPQQLPDGRGYEMRTKEYLRETIRALFRQCQRRMGEEDLPLGKRILRRIRNPFGKPLRGLFNEFETNDLLKPLHSKLEQSLNRLSGGERRRVELWARLYVLRHLPTARPALLILDEPTTGLDMPDEQRYLEMLREELKSLPTVSAIITTHALHLLEGDLFDRVILVSKEVKNNGATVCRISQALSTAELGERIHQNWKDFLESQDILETAGGISSGDELEA